MESIPGRQTTSRTWAIITLLCLAFMAAYFDRQNFSIALSDPPFKSFFQLSDSSRGLLNSAFFWSYAALQIPAGWVVDRYGVKRPFAIGFALWSLLAGATAWAGSATQLFMVRFLLGSGEAINTPAGMRWIRLNVADEKHGFVMGLYQASAKLGPAIGAPLTAGLILAYGWRTMFMVLGFGALLWLIPWLLLVRDDDRNAENKVVRKSNARPIDFAELMRNRVMWGIIIGTFCYNYFNYFCLTWLPAYFAEQRGLSLQSTGWFTGWSFWGFALVAIAAGWLADRLIAQGRDAIFTRKAFIVAGFLIASTELIGAASTSNRVALFFAMFSLSGLGLATGNYWALSPAILPGAPIARLAAVQNLAASLPGILAPILTGWLKSWSGGYEAPMAVNFLFLLLGIGSYVFLVRPRYAPV
ncbi:MAG: MFS transporter [Acidobacteriota bacterium]|nr:MFS transporter [Acidobacteriota bacterium]